MNGISFFDRAAGAGSQILDFLSGSQPGPDVEAYLRQVADIYSLMVSIHDIVADVTVEASLTDDLEVARRALRRIDRYNLEAVFRARSWCDELERLGRALRPLADSAGLDAGAHAVWGEFCGQLEMREGEVAYLYEEKLSELQRLADDARDGVTLKRQISAIANQLVTQKAEFDLLAKKARIMARQAGLH